MKDNVNNVKKEMCIGCGACLNICPSRAIVMEEDAEGFNYPVILEDKCIRCGKCVGVCPILKEVFGTDINKDDREVYAAWSLEREIRAQSTSGGIFSELAMSILDRGGYLCGAVYDDNHVVRHFITDKREDLIRLRQSKYVQSDMGDVYRELVRLLQRGELLLFCGSPCHCAAVYNFCEVMQVATEKLVLVDFICRGANSPKVYRKFLEELSSEYHSNVARVWFKNKTYGWNRFSTRIEFENGDCYLEDRYHDTYIRGYIEENLFIRPSCTTCHFKGFNRISDITLADFWGVELRDKMEESDHGTSMVLLHTKKGKELWEAIASRVFKAEKVIEDVVQGNPCFSESVQHGAHRDEFMRDLDRLPVIENIGRFLR